MGGSKATNHSGLPYREASKPNDPLTDGELALWDRVYASLLAHERCYAELLADGAVALRRKKFGVR